MIFVFHPVFSLIDKRLVEGFLMGVTGCGGIWVFFWWAGPCSVNLNPNVYWWVGLCSLLVVWPRPAMVRVMVVITPQKVLCQHHLSQDCCIQGPWPHSRHLSTHISTRDSWTLTGKSGSVSCGVTVPFSSLLLCTRFRLCPLRLCSPVLWKFYGKIPLAFKVKSLGLPSPFARFPSWRICCGP